MLRYNLLFAFLLIVVASSCVQPSAKKTIIARLNVAGKKDIQSVGLRGSEKPLSWDYDLALTPIIKDSLYEVSFSLVTGYKFTEGKFTINGDFELKDQGNRRIVFGAGDTTIYEAVFDVAKR
jgi:putative oxidoreductase